MPYIKSGDRVSAMSLPKTPGQLNYAITCLIRDYFKDSPNYQSINDVLGALEGAKFEFYARVAAPYELKKRQENGDVF